MLAEDFGKGKGWRPGVDYEFELAYHEDRIRISINGKTIFDLKGPKSPNPTGRFGFYNYSQAGVVYSGFTHQPAPRIELRCATRRAWRRNCVRALTDPDGAVRVAAAEVMANLRMRSAVADLKMRVADELWVGRRRPGGGPGRRRQGRGPRGARKLDPGQVRPPCGKL